MAFCYNMKSFIDAEAIEILRNNRVCSETNMDEENNYDFRMEAVAVAEYRYCFFNETDTWISQPIN